MENDGFCKRSEKEKLFQSWCPHFNRKREDAMAKVLCVDGLQKVSPWKKMHFSKRYLYVLQFRGWTVPNYAAYRTLQQLLYLQLP